MILIDPPTPFAPREDWEDFLKEMEELEKAHPDNEDIREHIEEAKRVLA